MPDIYEKFLDPKKLAEDTRFYKNLDLELFGNPVIKDSHPLAYDRRFKTPIFVEKIMPKEGGEDNVVGLFSRSPERIKLNPSAGRSWQQGDPDGTGIARHEIIHAFENHARKQHDAGKGVKYEPQRTSNDNGLMVLLNLLFGHNKLDTVLNKIYGMEETGAGFGGVSGRLNTMKFRPGSHWPNIGPGYPQYDKFTNEEQQVLKKFFADEATRLGYGKYRSLWE